MRTYRFFLKNPSVFPLLQKQTDFSLLESDEPEILFQLTKVLRAKPGDRVILSAHQKIQENHQNIQESMPFFEYHYEISDFTKKEITLKFLQGIENHNELSFTLELVLSLPNKPDKLEFILQKAVELGVARVVLVEADFSQMRHQLRPDRLQKIMTEAAEQSERAYVPELFIQGKLSALLEAREQQHELFVAMERLEGYAGNGIDLRGLAEKPSSNINRQSSSPISILVGPEGGFSETEKKIIIEKKFLCFSLGKRILRMETAVIVSLGLAAMFGEING